MKIKNYWPIISSSKALFKTSLFELFIPPDGAVVLWIAGPVDELERGNVAADKVLERGITDVESELDRDTAADNELDLAICAADKEFDRGIGGGGSDIECCIAGSGIEELECCVNECERGMVVVASELEWGIAASDKELEWSITAAVWLWGGDGRTGSVGKTAGAVHMDSCLMVAAE